MVGVCSRIFSSRACCKKKFLPRSDEKARGTCRASDCYYAIFGPPSLTTRQLLISSPAHSLLAPSESCIPVGSLVPLPCGPPAGPIRSAPPSTSPLCSSLPDPRPHDTASLARQTHCLLLLRTPSP